MSLQHLSKAFEQPRPRAGGFAAPLRSRDAVSIPCQDDSVSIIPAETSFHLGDLTVGDEESQNLSSFDFGGDGDPPASASQALSDYLDVLEKSSPGKQATLGQVRGSKCEEDGDGVHLHQMEPSALSGKDESLCSVPDEAVKVENDIGNPALSQSYFDESFVAATEPRSTTFKNEKSSRGREGPSIGVDATILNISANGDAGTVDISLEDFTIPSLNLNGSKGKRTPTLNKRKNEGADKITRGRKLKTTGNVERTEPKKISSTLFDHAADLALIRINRMTLPHLALGKFGSKVSFKPKGNLPQASTLTKDRIRQLEIVRNLGTWVECVKDSCKKWRFLPEVKDPSTLPDDWSCSLNPNQEMNNCEQPEESYSDENDEFVECKFTVGSIVWAKLDGFPWWPALVDDDPDTETFFWTDKDSKEPSCEAVMDRPQLVFPPGHRRKPILLDFISVLVRSVAICVGIINLWHVAMDKSRLEAIGGDTWETRVSAAGYDVIMLTNFVLIAGSILDWYLLVAAWILVYAFVIIFSCAKYISTGVFPWTPGISYTATIPVMLRFELGENVRPMVAETITLVDFLLVFLVFLANSLLSFKKEEERVKNLPIAIATRVSSLGATSVTTPYHHECVGVHGSLDDGLPSYSEVEADDHRCPPPYAEATKKTNLVSES